MNNSRRRIIVMRWKKKDEWQTDVSDGRVWWVCVCEAYVCVLICSGTRAGDDDDDGDDLLWRVMNGPAEWWWSYLLLTRNVSRREAGRREVGAKSLSAKDEAPGVRVGWALGIEIGSCYWGMWLIVVDWTVHYVCGLWLWNVGVDCDCGLWLRARERERVFIVIVGCDCRLSLYLWLRYLTVTYEL